MNFEFSKFPSGLKPCPHYHLLKLYIEATMKCEPNIQTSYLENTHTCNSVVGPRLLINTHSRYNIRAAYQISVVRQNIQPWARASDIASREVWRN